jgi:4-amino-4-deoxy-L-arabinose transferase-like glycosyltransferase
MRAFHHDLPLMLMSYLGTAKTWLYALVFRLWLPGIVSLRLPVVLIGGLTVWLAYRLVTRMAGRRTAFAVCALIATDATFILTTTFDWGPVAIQHLAYISGLLFVLDGFQPKSALRIAAGFLMFGLGMWDKAIFIWILSGTAVAVLILFRSELRTSITRRNVLAAALGFLIGASPLIVYNIRNPLNTFRGNAVFSTDGLDEKVLLIRRALSGSALFAYLVNDDWVAAPKPPRNGIEGASVELREYVGEQRGGLLFYALIASLLAAPLWWRRRRPVLFALIVMVVAWLQMAFTKDAGTGVHHVVLLWPLPHVVIGVALVEGTRRLPRASTAMFATILTVLCVSNVLVMNQYLYQFIRDGAGPLWSDAVMPLSDQLSRWKDRQLLMMDWGMEPTLRVLHKGNLATLWNVSDVVSHDLSAEDRAMVDRMFRMKGIFLTHTPKYEIQPGSIQRVLHMGEVLGYRRHLLQTIDDSNGRPVFEIAEFVK